MQSSTLHVVLDKQEAMLSTTVAWNQTCMTYWIAMGWFYLAPWSYENYLEPVIYRFFFKLWRCVAREVRLARRTTELLKADRIEACERITQRAETAAQSGDIRSIFQSIETLAPRPRPATNALVDREGRLCFDKQREFEVWCQHIVSIFDAEEIREGDAEPPTVYLMTSEQWLSSNGADYVPPLEVMLAESHVISSLLSKTCALYVTVFAGSTAAPDLATTGTG